MVPILALRVAPVSTSSMRARADPVLRVSTAKTKRTQNVLPAVQMSTAALGPRHVLTAKLGSMETVLGPNAWTVLPEKLR